MPNERSFYTYRNFIYMLLKWYDSMTMFGLILCVTFFALGPVANYALTSGLRITHKILRLWRSLGAVNFITVWFWVYSCTLRSVKTSPVVSAAAGVHCAVSRMTAVPFAVLRCCGPCGCAIRRSEPLHRDELNLIANCPGTAVHMPAPASACLLCSS